MLVRQSQGRTFCGVHDVLPGAESGGAEVSDLRW